MQTRKSCSVISLRSTQQIEPFGIIMSFPCFRSTMMQMMMNHEDDHDAALFNGDPIYLEKKE